MYGKGGREGGRRGSEREREIEIERERDRERETETERERDRDREKCMAGGTDADARRCRRALTRRVSR